MSNKTINQVLNTEWFTDLDDSAFPAHLQLRDILKNDARIRRYSPNQIIVRAGEYVNSAHIILSGQAIMILPPGISAGDLGQRTVIKPSIFKTIYNWIKQPPFSEVRSLAGGKGNSLKTKRQRTDIRGEFVSDINKIIETSDLPNQILNAGDVIGESAVLGRNEVTNTVVCNKKTVAIEIRWQGLRDIRRWAPEFRQSIDHLYRSRGLYEHLLTVSIFKELPAEKIQELASIALFEVHGEFEWHKSYSSVARTIKSNTDYDEIVQNEPLIVEEGQYPDGLLLIRNGFARISRQINHGMYTLGYLSAGDMFGLEELYDSWQMGNSKPVFCSLRALGYTDLIRIPTVWLENNIFRNASGQKLVNSLIDDNKNSNKESLSESINVDRALTEFLVEHRFINGSATMIIDLERCVRCDECVQACANNHGNNPRFIRRGKSFGKFMVAHACMHCEDPVCMIGCPTGAIHRSSVGIVNINDETCIGCATCANSCPYDNIQMVDIKDQSGRVILDKNDKPILKATKCDLCIDARVRPACERACPHDALVRLDVKDPRALSDWINH